MVVDEHHAGVPVSFVVHSKEDEETAFQPALAAFKRAVRADNPGWCPSTFIVDDCSAMHNAIRAEFPGVPISLCNWHVKRSWLKNLLEKVQDADARLSIFLELSDIMMGKGLDLSVAADPAVVAAGSADELLLQQVQQQLSSFCDRWRLCAPQFVQYFTTYWLGRAGMWVVALRRFPHAAQEGTQALEGMHSGLKGAVIRPAKRVGARRIDWLLHTLLEEVLPEHQRRSLAKAAGYQVNHAVAGRVQQAVQRARSIPRTWVEVHSNLSRAAVLSYSCGDRLHDVLQPGTAWSACTCEAGVRGLTCWHQVAAAFAVKGDNSETVRLFTTGQVGLAVRRPGLFQPAGPAAKPALAVDAWQLRIDLNSHLLLCLQALPCAGGGTGFTRIPRALEGALTATAAAGAANRASSSAAAIAAAADTGGEVPPPQPSLSADLANTRSGGRAVEQSAAGGATTAISAPAAAAAASPTQPTAASQSSQQYVSQAEGPVTDRRFKPVMEAVLQPGRSRGFVSTRKEREKVPRGHQERLEHDAAKAAASKAAAAAVGSRASAGARRPAAVAAAQRLPAAGAGPPPRPPAAPQQPAAPQPAPVLLPPAVALQFVQHARLAQLLQAANQGQQVTMLGLQAAAALLPGVPFPGAFAVQQQAVLLQMQQQQQPAAVIHQQQLLQQWVQQRQLLQQQQQQQQQQPANHNMQEDRPRN